MGCFHNSYNRTLSNRTPCTPCSRKNRIIKRDPQILIDISDINKITRNDLFEKRTGFKIDFTYDKKRRMILANFVVHEESRDEDLAENGRLEEVPLKSVVEIKILRLKIRKFYEFYTNLLNCLPIFYSQSWNGGFKGSMLSPGGKVCLEGEANDVTPEDDYLCVICLERKSNVMLKCYHSFCEDCIKLWLLHKDRHCPMCRKDVNISRDSSDSRDFVNRKWCLIDKGEINQNEYLQELDQIFVSSVVKLIS